MKTPNAATAIIAEPDGPDRQQAESSRSRRHSAFFKKRGALGGMFLIPIAGLMAFSQSLVQHGSAADHAAEVAGWSFFLAYVLFRVWATMYVGGRKDQKLQTHGPYSLCRNPLYLGSLCAALALVFFLHSLTLLVAVVVLAACYARLVIPSEEAVLRDRFGGAYDQYAARTPRFLPALTHYSAGEAPTVNLPAMRRELKRLFLMFVAVAAVYLLCHLRAQTWWPIFFTLP